MCCRCACYKAKYFVLARCFERITAIALVAPPDPAPDQPPGRLRGVRWAGVARRLRAGSVRTAGASPDAPAGVLRAWPPTVRAGFRREQAFRFYEAFAKLTFGKPGQPVAGRESPLLAPRRVLTGPARVPPFFHSRLVRRNLKLHADAGRCRHRSRLCQPGYTVRHERHPLRRFAAATHTRIISHGFHGVICSITRMIPVPCVQPADAGGYGSSGNGACGYPDGAPAG